MQTKNHKLSLSDAVARDAVVPDRGEYIISDSKIAYLKLRVNSSGTKTWIVEKKLGKGPCRVVLGVFSRRGASGGCGYQAAKAQVPAIVAQITQGVDPNLRKKQQLRVTERERELENFTMLRCMDIYIEDRVSAGMRPTSIRNIKSTRERFVSSSFSSEPIGAITVQRLVEYFDELAKKAKGGSKVSNGGKTQASQDLRNIRAAYNYCKLMLKLDLPAECPFKQLSHARENWYRVGAKNRIVALTAKNLSDWWRAVDELRLSSDSRATMADYMQLLLLWGGRRTETMCLKWENINLDDNYVIFPASNTKNGREHIFPLTSYARGIVVRRQEEMKEKNIDSPWLFTSRIKKNGEYQHISTPGPAMNLIYEKTKIKFSSHDLRRTFGTLFYEIWQSDIAVKNALNHAPDNTASVHYIVSRLESLREPYQVFEDKVLREAGVISKVIETVPVDKAEYEAYLAWKNGSV